MAEQMRKTAQPKQPPQREGESGCLREPGEKLNEHVEALLNDIDDVLEENAEEFVQGRHQAGRGVARPCFTLLLATPLKATFCKYLNHSHGAPATSADDRRESERT